MTVDKPVMIVEVAGGGLVGVWVSSSTVPAMRVFIPQEAFDEFVEDVKHGRYD